MWGLRFRILPGVSIGKTGIRVGGRLFGVRVGPKSYGISGGFGPWWYSESRPWRRRRSR